MMPLVPPSPLGAVTQLEVGTIKQSGVDKALVMIELSRNPSVEPTPKKTRSVVPSSNPVSGEHSSPFVLLTTKVDVAELVMTPLAKGNIYICGFDGAPLSFTNPHSIMCPDVDPYSQNALSNVAA
jgi:hypothetical protein